MWHRLFGPAIVAALALVTACASPPEAEPPAPATGVRVVRAAEPSEQERYCAWYGDAEGPTLYMGLAPFWSAMRDAGGDPRADLERAGPQWVGRFDLASEASFTIGGF